MAEVVVEVVSSSPFSSTLHRSNTAVRLLLEGLLAHFFSPYRPHYHRDDVLWFLRLANEQEQWCYNPFLGQDLQRQTEEEMAAVEMSVGVVAGGLEEDLITKVEVSTCIRQSRHSPLREVCMYVIMYVCLFDTPSSLPSPSSSPPLPLSLLSLPQTPQLPPGAIEQSVFKFHLGYILGSYTEQPGSDQSESGPLLLYCPEFRTLIGEVLADSEDLGPPGPYLPLFYQDTLSDNLKKFADVR